MTDKPRDNLDVTAPAKPVERPVVTPEANARFLNDFLSEEKSDSENAAENAAQQSDVVSPSEGATSGDLKEAVIDALKEIYDPEIPVNIYELGLIYGVDIDDSAFAAVTMTLTTPHCPVAESMPGEVEMRVAGVPGVAGAEVKLVWEPAWDMGRMSDEARLELGLL